MKTYTLALPTHTGSQNLNSSLCCTRYQSREKVTFLCTRQKPRRAFQNDGEEGECLEGLASPPSPWHMGHKCKALAGSPRTRSSPPGSGIRREGNWHVAAPLALAASCALPSQMGEVLHSWLRLEGLASQAWLGIRETNSCSS